MKRIILLLTGCIVLCGSCVTVNINTYEPPDVIIQDSVAVESWWF